MITDVFLLGNSPCVSVLFAMFHPHFPSTKRAAVNLLEQHITAHTGWGGWTRAAYEEIKLWSIMGKKTVTASAQRWGQRTKILNCRCVDGSALLRCWGFWLCWQSCCLHVPCSSTSRGSLEKPVFISQTQALRICLSLLLSLKCISYDKWPINTAMTFFLFLFFFFLKTLINRCCSCLLSKIWFTVNLTKAEPYWSYFYSF